MPWFILLGLGFLTGIAISNAWLRHHVLTLIIWISKSLRWIFSGLIWVCEWLQDELDDIDYVPQIRMPIQNQKIKEHVVEKPRKADAFNIETASQSEVLKYIHDHPEQVSVNRRGGE
jgi:hypothetical protein